MIQSYLDQAHNGGALSEWLEHVRSKRKDEAPPSDGSGDGGGKIN